MNPGIRFWEWFEQNQAQFLFVHQVDELEQQRMLNEFTQKLKEFNPELYFVIGTVTESDQELTITAEGNKDQFLSVLELVNCAPDINGWNIIAYKQPKGVDFTIEFKEHVIDPRNLYFRPLATKADPSALGIRVALPNYTQSNREQLMDVTYLILDTLLGEISFAEDISYIDIIGMSEDMNESPFIPLERLAEFIEWKKNRPLNA